jgi:hypothetical protein
MAAVFIAGWDAEGREYWIETDHDPDGYDVEQGATHLYYSADRGIVTNSSEDAG